MGTRPSGPTLNAVCTLQRYGHATRGRAQDAAFFALGGARGGVGRALKFMGVAVGAQVGQERVGRFVGGDGFGGEEGGQAALPVIGAGVRFCLWTGACGRSAGRLRRGVRQRRLQKRASSRRALAGIFLIVRLRSLLL